MIGVIQRELKQKKKLKGQKRNIFSNAKEEKLYGCSGISEEKNQACAHH